MGMEQKMWNDSNLMAMYDMGMPGMMPPVTPGSAMTNGIGSSGTHYQFQKKYLSKKD